MFHNLCQSFLKLKNRFVSKADNCSKLKQNDTVVDHLEPLLAENIPSTSPPAEQEVQQLAPPGIIFGRRLGKDDYKLEDGNKKLLLNAFIDTRIGTNLSFDNFGTGSCNSKTVSRLRDIVKKNNEIHGSNYDSWAVLNGKKIKHKIFLTPDLNPENPNPYHCELDRSTYTSKMLANSLAYELLNIASEENLFKDI